MRARSRGLQGLVCRLGQSVLPDQIGSLKGVYKSGSGLHNQGRGLLLLGTRLHRWPNSNKPHIQGNKAPEPGFGI